jgi:hypothetical protein
MTNYNEQQLELSNITELELSQINHPAWDEPIICRVEVDLPGWLAQLTGGKRWEVLSEDEAETCISFSMRELNRNQDANLKSALKTAKLANDKLAEVTLYHNGYAVVDVEGKALFDGTLTNGTSNYTHLSYFHAESGEPITLN